MTNPGGKGPLVTAGTLGGRVGVMLLAACLTAAGPELEADVELLSEPADGLDSGADAGPAAGVCTGVSDAGWLPLASSGAEPFLDDAEETIQTSQTDYYSSSSRRTAHQ